MTTFSLDQSEIIKLRGRGFSVIRGLSDEITRIANGIEELDAALLANTSCRSIDLQQNLVRAASRLSTLVDLPQFGGAE